MGSDAVEDYQQLGEQLDRAAQVVKKGRKKRGSEGSVAPEAAVIDHPAEPLPEPAEARREAKVEVAASEEETEPSATDRGEVTPDGEIADGEVSDTGSTKGLVDLPSLEALLFSTRHPLTVGRIGEIIDVPSGKALRSAIAELNRQYEESGRCFRVEQVAGGYQLLTLPVYGQMLARLHQREIDSKLSRSALETLAIIAYKQPVLRAEVEAIRGVASGETIRSLMEKHLVKIAGRAEEPGRPILYGTTKRFLEVFGLNSTKELPRDEQARPARPAAPAAPIVSVEIPPQPETLTAEATSEIAPEAPAAIEGEVTAQGNS